MLEGPQSRPGQVLLASQTRRDTRPGSIARRYGSVPARKPPSCWIAPLPRCGGALAASGRSQVRQQFYCSGRDSKHRSVGLVSCLYAYVGRARLEPIPDIPRFRWQCSDEFNQIDNSLFKGSGLFGQLHSDFSFCLIEYDNQSVDRLQKIPQIVSGPMKVQIDIEKSRGPVFVAHYVHPSARLPSRSISDRRLQRHHHRRGRRRRGLRSRHRRQTRSRHEKNPSAPHRSPLMCRAL